jgi:hypothetical protein
MEAKGRGTELPSPAPRAVGREERKGRDGSAEEGERGEKRMR